jgi:hypothetical protein
MPTYAALNTPPNGWKSWRVFLPMLRSIFPHFPTVEAKKIYTAVLSRVFENGAEGAVNQRESLFLPLVDFVNHDNDFNAKKTCDPKSGCRLIATKAIAAGEEIRISYGCNSNFFMLQKWGFELGKANLNAIGLDQSGCVVHFQKIGKYPLTGGINPDEWKCLRKKFIPFELFKWIPKGRKMVSLFVFCLFIFFFVLYLLYLIKY